MGIEASGRSGIVSDVNVVPLIDILLVLLVIFMIIPHRQVGLAASLPQEPGQAVPIEHPKSLIVQIGPDGRVRLNGSAVERGELQGRLEQVLGGRAQRVVFLQGDRSLEFAVVAEVLNVMHMAGASPVGLVTTELEKNH
ncbi:MAG TPA: biopolymer transporter ExbD [Candidatus Sulfotelmatobacter sp.]|nr:biopolymer transporter ExbD [Candidatus Sulfotelmatobacter sp.]